MVLVTESKKACAVNPLKMSQPLGAAYAFLGLDACMPLMHGSQGCTPFGLVLPVRHFKVAMPLKATAMNETTTLMEGFVDLEKALLNIRQCARPALIGICTTGHIETRGDDEKEYEKNMKWKKFLYKQLCEREQLFICKAASCAACGDRPVCFGLEQETRIVSLAGFGTPTGGEPRRV